MSLLLASNAPGGATSCGSARASTVAATSGAVAAVVIARGEHWKAVLIVDIDPAAVPVFGDAARMQQVTWNLLSNAVKFTPEGEVVRVSLARSATGAGCASPIPAAESAPTSLRRVFDAFRQEDASTTRVQPGLGLGLSIVKSLVEPHRGSITAHSEGADRGAFGVRPRDGCHRGVRGECTCRNRSKGRS